jgi:hypothetical protein
MVDEAFSILVFIFVVLYHGSQLKMKVVIVHIAHFDC